MIDRKKLARWLYENDGRDRSQDVGWQNEDKFMRGEYSYIATQLIKAIEDGELEPTPEMPCKHKFFSWSRLNLAWSRRCQKCGYQEITYRNPINEWVL